jgi:hypothetical protein
VSSGDALPEGEPLLSSSDEEEEGPLSSSDLEEVTLTRMEEMQLTRELEAQRSGRDDLRKDSVEKGLLTEVQDDSDNMGGKDDIRGLLGGRASQYHVSMLNHVERTRSYRLGVAGASTNLSFSSRIDILLV